MHCTANSKTNIRKTSVSSTSRSTFVGRSTKIQRSGKKSAKSSATNMMSRKALLRLICRHVGTASSLMYCHRVRGPTLSDSTLSLGTGTLLVRRLGVVCGTSLRLGCGPVVRGVIKTLCECSPGGPGVPMGGGSNKPPDFMTGEAGEAGSVESISTASPGAEDTLGLKDPEGTTLGAPDGPEGLPTTPEGDGDGVPEMDPLGWSGKRKLLIRRCLQCHNRPHRSQISQTSLH